LDLAFDVPEYQFRRDEHDNQAQQHADYSKKDVIGPAQFLISGNGCVFSQMLVPDP
jgi:hypothetical protein